MPKALLTTLRLGYGPNMHHHIKDELTQTNSDHWKSVMFSSALKSIDQIPAETSAWCADPPFFDEYDHISRFHQTLAGAGHTIIQCSEFDVNQNRYGHDIS